MAAKPNDDRLRTIQILLTVQALLCIWRYNSQGSIPVRIAGWTLLVVLIVASLYRRFLIKSASEASSKLRPTSPTSYALALALIAQDWVVIGLGFIIALIAWAGLRNRSP